MPKPLAFLAIGLSLLLAFLAGAVGVLIIEQPIAPVPGMAMSWSSLEPGPGLEQRLVDHNSYLEQHSDPEAQDVLQIGRLMTWATLAAVSDTSRRAAYLGRAELACHALEWRECTHDVILDVGASQAKGIRP